GRERGEGRGASGSYFALHPSPFGLRRRGGGGSGFSKWAQGWWLVVQAHEVFGQAGGDGGVLKGDGAGGIGAGAAGDAVFVDVVVETGGEVADFEGEAAGGGAGLDEPTFGE